MDKKTKKKFVAAIATVSAYIKDQEASLYMHSQLQETKAKEKESRACNLWGISGRQACMQANAMMQLRMFK